MNMRDTICVSAQGFVGKPYVWGGESMKEGGYDCSGLVYAVFKNAGIDLGRTTAEGYRRMSARISANEVLPGDLVFYGKYGTATHVAIISEIPGYIYESIGSSKNTRNNPGKGVIMSKISRRTDIMCYGRVIDEGIAVKEEKLDNSKWQYVFRAMIQYHCSVEVSGMNTVGTLEQTPTISKDKNRKHPVVLWVQQYLNRHGFDCGKEDGIAGAKFDAALKNWQKKNGCVSDGEMTSGKTSWKKMLGGV